MRESERIDRFIAREESRNRYARTYQLPQSARLQYLAVYDALQDAEELGGPEGQDYIALMQAIINECNARIDAAQVQGRTK